MRNKTDPVLQDEVDALSERLDEIEGRLNELEKAKGFRSSKRSRKPNPGTSTKKDPVEHNYLRKVINDAKRRYEQEFEPDSRE